MPQDDEVDYIVDIVEPEPNRRQEVREDVRHAVQVMRERLGWLEARRHAHDLTPAETRDQLRRLSKTLARAAKLARGLGPYNEMLGSRIGSIPEARASRSNLLLSDYLQNLQRLADDQADAVPVGKGHPQRDSRGALAAHYAFAILMRNGGRSISSSEDGKFRSLAESMYEHAFGEAAHGKLERYVKREVKFHKAR